MPAANDGAYHGLKIILLGIVEVRTYAGPEAEEAKCTRDIIMETSSVIRRDGLEKKLA